MKWLNVKKYEAPADTPCLIIFNSKQISIGSWCPLVQAWTCMGQVYKTGVTHFCIPDPTLIEEEWNTDEICSWCEAENNETKKSEKE